MWYKTLLNIFRKNEAAKEALTVALYIFMAVVIFAALLMMDARELDFIYANF